MILPDWLDYASSENAAAALLRGLRGLSGDWGQMIADAQAIMGFYQDTTDWSRLEALYQEDEAVSLIAAARVLDSAAQMLTNDPAADAQALGLSGAVAYAMYANFPSAKAVLRRMRPSGMAMSASTAVIMALADPQSISELLEYCGQGTDEGRFLELLGGFLYTGDLSRIDELRERQIQCLLNAGSSLESALLRSCRVVLEHILHLSLAAALVDVEPQLPADYVRKLSSRVPILLPTQYQAIIKDRLLEGDSNAVVTLPTSTGKTLLGELCLMSALGNSPGLVCYVAPWNALGRQVATRLQLHLPAIPEIRIRSLFGGFREVEALRPEDGMEVVVATPERFDALLRTAPNLLTHLRALVFDEAHLVQSDSRGILLEGILTRLRILQEGGSKFRLILLSAVVGNSESLQRWLGASRTQVVSVNWRPTARRLAFWLQNGDLVWYLGDDPVRRPGTDHESVLGTRILPWPHRDVYATKHYGQIVKSKPSAHANVAYLAQTLIDEYGFPVLLVCSTVADTRNVAESLAKRFPYVEPIPRSLSGIVDRIETRHRFLLRLGDMVKRGIAFHNSTVPRDVSQLIEEAAERGDLQAVVSTSTLAEGVDLPFRFTILVDWLSWRGSQQAPISQRYFQNVAGRCGRAGSFTEGDTVVFDNPIGDYEYTQPNRRWSLQRSIFFARRPEDLTSAIELIGEMGDTESKAYLLATLGSQFLAAVPENLDAENLPERFASHSFFARSTDEPAELESMLDDMSVSLLDQEEGAMAIAASPIRLTELGAAANATGFSPESCRRIAGLLSDHPPISISPAPLCAHLLRHLGDLPEQTNSDLRKLLQGKRTKVYLSSRDLDVLADLWLQGEYEEAIFAALPKASLDYSLTA